MTCVVVVLPAENIWAMSESGVQADQWANTKITTYIQVFFHREIIDDRYMFYGQIL